MLILIDVHLLLNSLQVWMSLLRLLREVDLTMVTLVDRRYVLPLSCNVGYQRTVRVLMVEKRVVACGVWLTLDRWARRVGMEWRGHLVAIGRYVVYFRVGIVLRE